MLFEREQLKYMQFFDGFNDEAIAVIEREVQSLRMVLRFLDLLSRKRLSRACGSIDWKIYVRTAWVARNPTHLRVHGQQSVSIFKWRGALQGG